MRRRIYNFFCAIHRIVTSPSLNMTSGVILILCGMSELLAGLGEGFTNYIGVQHGMAIFGFIEFFKALPNVMRGLRFVEDGEGVFVPPQKLAGARQESVAG